MNKSFSEYCKELENKIRATYEEGITLDDAEKLAAEFLVAQLTVSTELKVADLDARMKKSGLKAVKAGVFLSEVQKAEKKPSDSMLEQLVNSDELVNQEQDRFDTAEVDRDALERYYNIFREAHIYYRGVSKGRFE